MNTIGGSTESHTPQQQHQQQPQVYNTSPLSATYVHENAQYVVPSVDTVRGFPTRGGIVPKRGRKRRHTATVHNMTPETAERNRCRICNKQFKRPSSLQTHYYSHTGEKIFKCPWDGCGRLFSVKSNMTRHYRLHERDFKRAQDLQFGPSQPQQPQQHQPPGMAASHAPTTALQQQEPFNTNNQNLGSSDSAANHNILLIYHLQIYLQLIITHPYKTFHFKSNHLLLFLFISYFIIYLFICLFSILLSHSFTHKQKTLYF